MRIPLASKAFKFVGFILKPRWFTCDGWINPGFVKTFGFGANLSNLVFVHCRTPVRFCGQYFHWFLTFKAFLLTHFMRWLLMTQSIFRACKSLAGSFRSHPWRTCDLLVSARDFHEKNSAFQNNKQTLCFRTPRQAHGEPISVYPLQLVFLGLDALHLASRKLPVHLLLWPSLQCFLNICHVGQRQQWPCSTNVEIHGSLGNPEFGCTLCFHPVWRFKVYICGGHLYMNCIFWNLVFH